MSTNSRIASGFNTCLGPQLNPAQPVWLLAASPLRLRTIRCRPYTNICLAAVRIVDVLKHPLLDRPVAQGHDFRESDALTAHLQPTSASLCLFAVCAEVENEAKRIGNSPRQWPTPRAFMKKFRAWSLSPNIPRRHVALPKSTIWPARFFDH